MPTLRETQQRFFELITAPEDVAKTLQSRGLPAAHVDEIVAGDARRSSLGRLDIYANMYFFRLLEILQDQFPSLAEEVGPDRFHNLVTSYLQAHPPDDPSVRHVGRHLPEFVDDPGLRELAELDRARLDCFDAPDADTLTVDDVRALTPDQLVALPLSLVSAHRLLRQGGQTLLVWRQDCEVFHRPLADDERALLGQAASFGEVCERLAVAAPEDAAARAFALLFRWVSDGLIASVKI
jgi:hypothetical protein